MNSMIVFASLLACAAATLVVPGPIAVRAPSHDSAIIQSHRLGGNFAYSTHEAHAYAVQTPVIGTRTIPVGVSYHQGVPVVKSSTNFVTQHIPQYGLAVSQVATAGLPYPYLAGAAPAIVAAAPAAIAVEKA
ncbi:uncharacterized protein [Macrobrachium rosenbergii]|uniref:uncharacterized protein n=1 Tax=Macrobrachium rosenbergii TaxID=79674 RepID=UPI0034D41EC6